MGAVGEGLITHLGLAPPPLSPEAHEVRRRPRDPRTLSTKWLTSKNGTPSKNIKKQKMNKNAILKVYILHKAPMKYIIVQVAVK